MKEAANKLNKPDGSSYRLTLARREIVAILCEAKRPLSAIEISVALQQRGIKADRSTIYRQLAFLEKRRIIRSVQFDERRRRYEIAAQSHHHHLVCINCRTIEDVTCRKAISAQEKEIFRDKNFLVLKHSLEFFGLCANCREEGA